MRDPAVAVSIQVEVAPEKFAGEPVKGTNVPTVREAIGDKRPLKEATEGAGSVSIRAYPSPPAPPAAARPALVPPAPPAPPRTVITGVPPEGSAIGPPDWIRRAPPLPPPPPEARTAVLGRPLPPFPPDASIRPWSV